MVWDEVVLVPGVRHMRLHVIPLGHRNRQGPRGGGSGLLDEAYSGFWRFLAWLLQTSRR